MTEQEETALLARADKLAIDAIIYESGSLTSGERKELARAYRYVRSSLASAQQEIGQLENRVTEEVAMLFAERGRAEKAEQQLASAREKALELQSLLTECLPIVRADTEARHMVADGLGEVVDGIPTGHRAHIPHDDLLERVIRASQAQGAGETER